MLADVRYYLDGRSGRAAYESGHLPGAVFVDIDAQLAAHGADPALGRHPLPAPEAFAADMAALGIGDDDVVVAYDDQGGIMAARLVWMLRATGHEAALLDGGIQAWDGPLETETPRAAAARASARAAVRAASPRSTTPPTAPTSSSTRASASASTARPTRWTSASATSPAPTACPAARTCPRTATCSRPTRCGAKLEQVGIDGEAPVVSYCGSGVTACHNLLVIEHAGLGSGRLFPGSWSQWSRDPERPVETE